MSWNITFNITISISHKPIFEFIEIQINISLKSINVGVYKVNIAEIVRD